MTKSFLITIIILGVIGFYILGLSPLYKYYYLYFGKKPPQVSREEVINLMRSDQVLSATFTHRNNLVLTLKDNTATLKDNPVVANKDFTTEDFFKEMKECGEICSDTGFSIE